MPVYGKKSQSLLSYAYLVHINVLSLVRYISLQLLSISAAFAFLGLLQIFVGLLLYGYPYTKACPFPPTLNSFLSYLFLLVTL